MHTPPRLALLTALGLLALLPSLPLGRRVNANEHSPHDIYSLDLVADGPLASQRGHLEIALVKPGAYWPGPLASHIPGQPLLLTQRPVPFDVLMRSRDGLWAARETIFTKQNDGPVTMQLEARGVLSGFVHATEGTPAAQCLITARSSDGKLFTQLTGGDGSFRFSWLPEAKYTLSTPPSVHGACQQETLCIAGRDIRLQLQPQPTAGEAAEVIGKVHSQSGEYRNEMRVKLWPLDAHAAPQDTAVVWNETSNGVISGQFNVPATLGEQYVMSLEKNDILPASFTRSPIQAPSAGVEIFFDDTRPHTTLSIKPASLDSTGIVSEFEVALSWGHGVTWRKSADLNCSIEGVPCNTPVAWMVRAPNRTPAYGETVFTETESLIKPDLILGWGEGLKVIHPDGTPASELHVFLDAVSAGMTDSNGTLTLSGMERPETFSLRTENHRVFGAANSVRPLSSLTDRDELGRLLIVLLPRD
jgi:hypothetical protein